MEIASKVKLNDGHMIPIFGFGVSQIPNGEPTKQAVTWALEAGYRHIDAAWLYRNEEAVGTAIRDFPIERKDVWVTTKLYPNQFASPRRAIEQSLRKLDIDYIDLYLVHWPPPIEVRAFDKKLWWALESFREEGLCRSIGVSNYLPGRLARLLNFANTPPSVNQILFSPLHFHQKLYEYCNQQNIKIVGYRPLGRGKGLTEQRIMDIAKKSGKTAAQIMLRWAIQKGTIPIPRSAKQDRIIENAQVFDFVLSQDDMDTLDAISKVH
jgi:2,5-diketo-D-gluconate reductase A